MSFFITITGASYLDTTFFVKSGIFVLMKRILALLSLCVLLCSCSSSRKNTATTIGVDPSWYPLELPGREKNVLAFSIELLQHIAKREKLELVLVRKNWDDLVPSLKKKEILAALSTLTPYIFYEDKYSFSAPYLLTGATLVLPMHSKQTSLEEFSGKEVGIIQGAAIEMRLQQISGLLIRPYPSVPELFKALVDEQIDAAVVDFLTAQAYVRDLFQSKLKVVGSPITEEGLRLITLYNKNPKLIEKFNLGLSYLKTTGEYDTLLHKWGLLSPEGTSDVMNQKIEAFLKDSL
jgi:polar amino acid transport system substrate-binding protein